MKKKVALIFGISGQSGAYLAHLLLSKDYEVHGTSRDCERASFESLRRIGCKDKVHLHSVALSDARNIYKIIDKTRPDEIYNLAGQSSVALSFDQPIETFDSNAVGTLNILECLRDHQLSSRLFNAVSTDCFGETLQPADELSAMQPRSPYAMAKAAAFWAVSSYRQSYGLQCCSGILSNHESPLRPTRFVTRKIVSTAYRIANGSGERLEIGNLEIQRDWGWAPDYVYAMWKILQQDQLEDFVVATGKTTSLKTFVSLVFSSLGLDWKDHVDVNPSLFRPFEITRSELMPDKARNILKWSPTITLPELASVLVDCERQGSLGRVPWSSQPLSDAV